MTPLAALEADPFLPAVEWLRKEGRLDETQHVGQADLARLSMNHYSVCRPLFELIPDHTCRGRDGCHYTLDAARWRPL